MMKKFGTFKEVVKHYTKSAQNYRRLTVWFDGYFCILDNHYGAIKKTIGHEDPNGKVSFKEIEDYYQTHKDEYEIELQR
tara:strand:- start:1248 stop:1484 length:237 start_codon:yes stop_codon:yes gene_type:complete